MKFTYFIYNFLSFIVKPSFYRTDDYVLSKLFYTILLYAINVLFLSGMFLINNYFLNFFGKLSVRIPQFSFESVTFIIAATIIGPIIEELTFRLPLKYSFVNICISFSLALSLIIRAFYSIKSIVSFPYLQTIIIALFIFTISYWVISKNRKVLKHIQLIYSKHSALILYFSVVSFTLCHLSNYVNLSISILPLAIFSLSDKLFAGFSFSYLRIRFGLFYSILLHFLNNTIGILLIKKIFIYIA